MQLLIQRLSFCRFNFVSLKLAHFFDEAVSSSTMAKVISVLDVDSLATLLSDLVLGFSASFAAGDPMETY